MNRGMHGPKYGIGGQGKTPKRDRFKRTRNKLQTGYRDLIRCQTLLIDTIPRNDRK